MKIASINNNSNNFKGLHFKPGRRMKAEYFLENPFIKQCSKEHEVVIKKVNKLTLNKYKTGGIRHFAEAAVMSFVSISAFLLSEMPSPKVILGSLMVILATYLTDLYIPKLNIDRRYHVQAGEGIDEKGNLTGKTSEVQVMRKLEQYMPELSQLTDPETHKNEYKRHSYKISKKSFNKLHESGFVEKNILQCTAQEMKKLRDFYLDNDLSEKMLYVYAAKQKNDDKNNESKSRLYQDLENSDLSAFDDLIKVTKSSTDKSKLTEILLSEIYQFLYDKRDSITDNEFTAKLYEYINAVRNNETYVAILSALTERYYKEQQPDKNHAEIIKNVFENEKTNLSAFIFKLQKASADKLEKILSSSDFDSIESISDALTNTDIQSSHGELLNKNPKILLSIPDILKTEENAEEYEEMLDELRNLYSVNYNIRDEYGVSFFEKVINSENFELLNFIKDEHITYYPELDYAYSQIENPEFKKEIDDMPLDFADIRAAVRLGSVEAIEKLEPQLKSPFFTKKAIYRLAKNLSLLPKSNREYFCIIYKNILPDYFQSLVDMYDKRKKD